MLSSIASLLPSALHLNPNQVLPRPALNPDTEDEDDPDDNTRRTTYTEEAPQPTKKEKEKEAKMPNEVLRSLNAMQHAFISKPEMYPSSTQPPPSKSNHPLNLQVQLVPPNAKPPSGVVPTDGTTPTSATSNTSTESDGASVARSNSTRSEASIARSFYNTSTSSFSSVASSTVSSNTRRTIIPLYNLQAHNVMTNVIVDAGTDAKIAKFQRRGIELIDLAFLEPVEVWGEKDRDKDARRESMRISVDEMGALVTNVGAKSGMLSARASTFLQAGGSRPVTPSATSSATSLHSHSNLRVSNPPLTQEAEIIPVVPVVQQQLAPAPPAKRNIFNKLFNKRNSTSLPPPGLNLPSFEQPEKDSSPFANFTLQPAPMTNKLLGKDAKRLGRGTPTPPPPALDVPISPASTTSQQPTPTPRTPRPQDDSPISPTPTVGPAKEPPKEKGHGRNLSITSFKTSLRNNRIDYLLLSLVGEARLSLDAVMAADAASSNGHGGSSNGNGGGGGGSQLQHQQQYAQQQQPSTPQQSLYPLMLTQTQVREELVNLKQQQLQLRPPILGIQPSFVSSSNPPGPPGPGIASPLVAALSPRPDQENVLQGQRALMYVWLVRKWLKRRPSTIAGVPNPFGEQGLFGGLAGKVGKHHQDLSAHGYAHGQEGSTSGAPGAVFGGGAPAPLPYGGVEVRFEWKRARGKERKGGSKKSTRRGRQSTGRDASFAASTGAESDGEVERGGRRDQTRERGERDREREFRERDRTRERDEWGDPKERLKSEAKRAKRMSTGSFSTTHSVSEEGGGDSASVRERRRLRRESALGGGGDEDEDSDPEDSETPWVCTLKVRKSVPVATVGGVTSPGAPPPGVALLHPQVLRVKVGTLSPTPHHPKVVAMLKVPFPLPDVEVERMGIVRRKGFPGPIGNPRPDSRGGPGGVGGGPGYEREGEAEDDEGREPYTGLTLTAEEIKDMVCSTGLWLVVREGFGGVGRLVKTWRGPVLESGPVQPFWRRHRRLFAFALARYLI
ncbi:hypothetical protein CPB84DRAFT_1747619 [Gymnopilus junonius]|uniref:Uncharacterized protein n=1 Tax=Gymnopilus junonius TaxID=109634 RepID=A0A9P5NKG0_GYMJU|nr:hypothetical protein CPB84DRAFT_1747619 [Gymnopilus junonius]